GGARRTGVARADSAGWRADAAPGERVDVLILTVGAEHVRLIRQVDSRLLDRPRIEREGDRQRTQAGRRRRRTVVARRIVAVDSAVARNTRQAVVDAAVAFAGGGVADRARLDERLAGAARAVPVRDAPEAGDNAAHAATGLAAARAALAIIAAGCSAAGTASRVVDARAAPRTRDASAAAAATRAVRTRRGAARAAHRHKVARQEDPIPERQTQVRGAPRVAVRGTGGVRGDRVDDTRARRHPA